MAMTTPEKPAAAKSRAARALAAICGFSIAAAWLLPAPENAQPQVVQIEQMLAQLASGEAEEKAQDVAGEDGLVSGGMPCFMRHKRMALGIGQPFRARFAAATIATDPEIKSQMLADLAAQAPAGMAAWRVAIARAELALRSGQPDAAQQFLAQAAQYDVPSACRADELFLLAQAAPPDDAAHLLDRALVADGGFWAAQEQLALLAARGTGTDPAACDADAARTMRSATQLAALAQMDGQFQRIERALAGQADSGRVALLRGMIFRATNRPEKAIETWKQGLSGLSGSACDRTIGRALQGMIENEEAKS